MPMSSEPFSWPSDPIGAATGKFSKVFFSLHAAGALNPARIVGNSVRSGLGEDLNNAIVRRFADLSSMKPAKVRDPQGIVELRSGVHVKFWQKPQKSEKEADMPQAEGGEADEPRQSLMEPEFTVLEGWAKVDSHLQFLFILDGDIDVDHRPSTWQGHVITSCRLNHIDAVRTRAESMEAKRPVEVQDTIAALSDDTGLVVVEVGGELPTSILLSPRYPHDIPREKQITATESALRMQVFLEQAVLHSRNAFPSDALERAARVMQARPRARQLRDAVHLKLPSGLAPFSRVNVVDWRALLTASAQDDAIELDLIFGNGAVERRIKAPGQLQSGAMNTLESLLLGANAESQGLQLPACERARVALNLAETILIRGWLADVAPDVSSREKLCHVLLDQAEALSRHFIDESYVLQDVHEIVAQGAHEAAEALDANLPSVPFHAPAMAIDQRLRFEKDLTRSVDEAKKLLVEEDLNGDDVTLAVSGTEVANQGTHKWVYDAGDGEPMCLRAVPIINGPRNRSVLKPGEVFEVMLEKLGEDRVLFLKLADGRGWAFDHKPGVGLMCERHSVLEEKGLLPIGPALLEANVQETRVEEATDAAPIAAEGAEKAAAIAAAAAASADKPDNTVEKEKAKPAKAKFNPAWSDTAWADKALKQMQADHISISSRAGSTLDGRAAGIREVEQGPTRACSNNCTLQ